jgi:Trypsin-like peptidase domain
MTRCPAAVALVALMGALCPHEEARAQKPADPPAAIAPNAVRATKQATVMLKVSTANGRVSEGSGFFALEPGIVVTNAHVLGMLRADSKVPTKVEVIVGSGTANELKLTGTVLGVDRVSDLALLKVDAKPGVKLPTPLKFGDTDDLVETQKVYIFGFPFGSDLGKNITVSESSVSSLRTGARGELTQIQVNGGMHPGNSGGPVVDTRGDVIGVSVSVVRNTQINFAVPAPSAQALFAGSVLDWTVGEAYREGADARLPLRLSCLDPLSRVRGVRVEVWAGKPSDKRAFNPKDEKPQPGDGPRHPHALKYAQGSASGDVPLPKLAPGEVAWVQPVLVMSKGDPVRGAPRAFDAASAVERVATELSAKLADQKERTVQLKSSQSLTLSAGKKKFTLAQTAELALTETFSPNPKGALVTVAFGVPKLGFAEDGEVLVPSRDVVSIVQRVPPRFVVDETNKLRERADINLNPNLPLALREQVGEYMTQICNAYEAATFVLPNKKVQPRDSWRVQQPMLLKTGARPEVADLVMVCTFEGVRPGANGPEALVTFEGTLQGRTAKERLEGRVTGRFTLDTKRGFISSVRLTIASELATPGGELEAALAFDVELKRTVAPGGAPEPKIDPAPKKEPKAIPDPDAIKELFTKPAASKQPVSYLKLVSDKDDYIGLGKKYDYTGEKLTDKLAAKLTPRELTVHVDGWILVVSGLKGAPLKVGEYPSAGRRTGDAGLDVIGQSRGSNKVVGAFVVWELEVKDDKVVKLALDFLQHSEGQAPALRGKLRINSSFE